MIKKQLSRLTGDTKTIECPKCLAMVEVSTTLPEQRCTVMFDDEVGRPVPCHCEFPLRYILEYGTAKTVPVQVFGWTMHGKTVYLDVLRLMLRGMQKVWPDYVYESFTKDDLFKEREVTTDLLGGLMPPSTQVQSRLQNIIYIMHLKNMIRWRSRSLVILDHAGERFGIDNFKLEVNEIPFLQHKDTTTMMFISIPKMLGLPVTSQEKDTLETIDLSNKFQDIQTKPKATGELMDQLANIYIEAMVKDEQFSENTGAVRKIYNIGVKKIRQQVLATPTRKIVVVLTMSDKIVHKLPERLREYLAKDNLWDRLYVYESESMTNQEIERYLEEMLEVSDAIRHWLLNDVEVGAKLGGTILVNLLDSHNIQARYSIISATGHDGISTTDPNNTVDKHFGTEITPKRVLDPLFWVMEMQDSYSPLR